MVSSSDPEYASDGEEGPGVETVEDARLRHARLFLEEAHRCENAPSRVAGHKTDVFEIEGEQDERITVWLRAVREAEAITEPLTERLTELGFDGDVAANRALRLRGHRGPPTCVALSQGGGVFSGSKDNGLLQHDAATGKRVRALLPRWPAVACDAVERARRAVGGPGQRATSIDQGIALRQAREGEVLCCACAPDGRLLAAGGTDGLVHVWDLRVPGPPVHMLRGHRGQVLCLAFREATGDQLISGGMDGTLKRWRAGDGAYVETLFGHAGPVRSLDYAANEQPLSGGGDHTARLWKVCDETHRVFRAPTTEGLGTSVDACRHLGGGRFITAGDNGSLALWTPSRKKPAAVLRNAHGRGPAAQIPDSGTGVGPPRWLSALAAPCRADVVASGSCDGAIRLWGVAAQHSAGETLDAFAAVPQLGFVNALACPRDAAFIAAAIAKEPRLGRWEKVHGAPNAIVLFPLLAAAAVS
mmetsp:Transcript_3933/g.11617  ORF Transcript_3933/g.11617 Transcript_3933/m.11617 type:complete len:473 (+) Transcript_3933:151-1569(+)